MNMDGCEKKGRDHQCRNPASISADHPVKISAKEDFLGDGSKDNSHEDDCGAMFEIRMLEEVFHNELSVIGASEDFSAQALGPPR